MTIKLSKVIQLDKDNPFKNIGAVSMSIDSVVEYLRFNHNVQIDKQDSQTYNITLTPQTSLFAVFEGYNKFKGTLKVTQNNYKQSISIELSRSLNLSGWCALLLTFCTYGVSLLLLAVSIRGDSDRVEKNVQKALDELDFYYN